MFCPRSFSLTNIHTSFTCYTVFVNTCRLHCSLIIYNRFRHRWTTSAQVKTPLFLTYTIKDLVTYIITSDPSRHITTSLYQSQSPAYRRTMATNLWDNYAEDRRLNRRWDATWDPTYRIWNTPEGNVWGGQNWYLCPVDRPSDEGVPSDVPGLQSQGVEEDRADEKEGEEGRDEHDGYSSDSAYDADVSCNGDGDSDRDSDSDDEDDDGSDEEDEWEYDEDASSIFISEDYFLDENGEFRIFTNFFNDSSDESDSPRRFLNSGTCRI